MIGYGMSRRRLLQGVGALGSGLLLDATLAGWARAKQTDGLIFGLSTYPPSIKPWENAGTAAATVKLSIYRGLLGYDNAGNLRSEIAESWGRDGDTTLVFKLRDNAKFHNGEKVTSADVKWTFEQIVDAKSTAYLRTEFGEIEKIETPDPLTVRVTLKHPSATFFYLVSGAHAPIISMKSTPEKAVGAGPFVIKSMEKGTGIELGKFDGFYKPGLPKLKTLKYVAYADENLRVAALQAGDVDLIEYVPWQSMEAISKNPNLKLDALDGPFMYLLFNVKQGPFANAKLRAAIAFAVNRDEIIKAAFFGRGSAMEGLPIPKNSPFFNPEASRFFHHDPERARKLLAEGGQPNGFATSLLSTATYGMHKDTAEIVQQNLAAIGVQAELKLPDWATRVALGNKGQYDFAVQGTAADYNDPDALSAYLATSQSASYSRSFGFSSERIDKLLHDGRTELDEGKRRAIYDALQKVASEEVPLCPLAWRSQGYGMQSYVTGFKNLPGFLTFHSALSLDETAIA